MDDEYYHSDDTDAVYEYGSVRSDDGYMDGGFDTLLGYWKDYLEHACDEELLLIPADLYGTGTVDQLRALVEGKDAEAFANSVPNLRPRCAGRLREIYTGMLGAFCQGYVTDSGDPLNIGDFGAVEPDFYRAFEDAVGAKTVLNVWDLWSKPPGRRALASRRRSP